MQTQTWQGHTAQEKAAWARREESSAALTHRLLLTSSRVSPGSWLSLQVRKDRATIKIKNDIRGIKSKVW